MGACRFFALAALTLPAIILAEACKETASNCPSQSGEILCGLCTSNSGSNAGQCRYCGDNFRCAGDLCADFNEGLSCTASTAGGCTNGSPGPGCAGGGADSSTANETGGGGTVTATDNGNPECPLGYTQGVTAVGNGSNVTVQALCTGGGFTLVFSPTPAPGGTAPCTLGYSGSSEVGLLTTSEKVTGTVTVNGTTGDLTVSGSCTCSGEFEDAEGNIGPSFDIVATFSDLPLSVQ